MICHILIVHVLSHYIVNLKGCRCVPARCRYFSGKMSLKVHADVAIWAVYAISRLLLLPVQYPLFWLILKHIV